MFSTGGTWRCDISLFFKYDSENRPLRLADERRVSFGKTLYDKCQVEPFLRRAQAAILNPSTSYEEFVSISDDDLKNYHNKNLLKFSRNTIIVAIHDPNGANLSFLDLPGEHVGMI